MVLRGEVDNPRPGLLVQVGLSQLDESSLTTSHVIVVHLSEAFLELECDAFAHDSYGVDRINQSLSL
jgi:hypothetical protein